MQHIIVLIYKIVLKVIALLRIKINHCVTWLIFYINGTEFAKFKTNGIPYVMIARGGKFSIGTNFRINNGLLGNPIGRPQRCMFIVDKEASLIIGKNVGLSSTAIVAHKSIIVGNNVKIGGGVCIYDTDFHSLDVLTRANAEDDFKQKAKAAVIIKENAFIGAHVTILKGVTIGRNSIIGACSVVTKSIPENEIWAGNPAKFIKNIVVNE